jgi:hypothetical protein
VADANGELYGTFCFLEYDPTNGTVSPGDIIYHKGPGKMVPKKDETDSDTR